VTVTLDTSGLFTLVNRKDPKNALASQSLVASSGPYLVPSAILSEITYLIEQRMPPALDRFLADIESGRYRLDCGDNDTSRVRQLVKRYEDLPLGFADAAVVACAERNGGSVLTFDRRDFGVVAREGRISLLPDYEHD
jgi:hypothetical protein